MSSIIFTFVGKQLFDFTPAQQNELKNEIRTAVKKSFSSVELEEIVVELYSSFAERKTRTRILEVGDIIAEVTFIAPLSIENTENEERLSLLSEQVSTETGFQAIASVKEENQQNKKQKTPKRIRTSKTPKTNKLSKAPKKVKALAKKQKIAKSRSRAADGMMLNDEVGPIGSSEMYSKKVQSTMKSMEDASDSDIDVVDITVTATGFTED